MNPYKTQKAMEANLAENTAVELTQDKQAYAKPKIVRYGRLSDNITFGYGVGNEVDSSYAN